jgi:hypothetical protein
MRSDASITVPTLNSAENLAELVPAIASSLARLNYEIRIRFGLGHGGISKPTLVEQTRYLTHPVRLYASHCGIGGRVQRACQARA